MSFDTVDLLSGNVFQVTWDTGRRCNYDCSYCPAHRHDNFSKHATLEELQNNTDFIFEYIDLYMEYRKFKMANIGFTGGEPTVNPNFIPFVKYLRKEYNEKYSHKWKCGFAITTNGAMSSKMADALMENLGHATVSYHAESDDRLKQQVRDRIMQLHTEGPKHDFSISVNVMFHAAYFDECKELCDWLHENDVKYVPRVIGEEPGSRNNFAHSYNEEQLDYMKNYWKYKNAEINNEKEVSDRLRATGEPTREEQKAKEVEHKKKQESEKKGYKIGRPCCGSREMCLSKDGESRKSTFVDFREFKGWNCSVNWFFLHLEQQTDTVWHHQTCQAQFGQTRGPIGKISEGRKIIEDLRQKLETGTMPTIVCPKHTCGCGLCAPKSKYKENYKEVLYNHVDKKVFRNVED